MSRSNSLTILGSSSGAPQPDRATSGYLLQVGESLNLLDAGSGVCASFLRHGFDPRQLDRIFISHTHSDHVADLTLFVQMLHGYQVERRVTLYLPDEFVEPFRQYLPAVYLFEDRLKFDLDIQGYAGGWVFEDHFKLKTIHNSHLSKLHEWVEKLKLPNRLQCHSFVVSLDNHSFLYSADLGGFDDIEPHLRHLDYALIESTHIDVQKVIEHARSSTVKQYILTHLGDKAEVRALQSAIDRTGLENIRLASDGLKLEL